MLTYMAHRFLVMIPTLLAISVLVFIIIQLPPGDYLTTYIAELQAQGVQLVGAGTPQVFIHPKSAHGVMIQLWPKDRPHRWRDGGS